MRPWRKFAAGRHWRPLLETPRDDLLAYAQQHGLSWLDDPSNEDTRHDRNFLRQRILPLLRERWPQADASFARSAVLNADAVELLDQEDALALAMVRSVDPQALSASALLELAAPRRARVLRRWIEALGFPPLPGEGVAQIESDLLQARADARARVRMARCGDRTLARPAARATPARTAAGRMERGVGRKRTAAVAGRRQP